MEIGNEEKDYKLVLCEDLRNIKNFCDNKLENEIQIPGKYKIIIKSFLKKLDSHKHINFVFSNSLNYGIILLALLSIGLVIINMSILIIIFWIYIILLVFNINLQNKYREKILQNVKSICTKYDNILGNLFYVKVQIKNQKIFKFFDSFSLEVKIFVLLQFLKENQNNEQTLICYNSFPKTIQTQNLKFSRKLKEVYLLDKNKIKSYSQILSEIDNFPRVVKRETKIDFVIQKDKQKTHIINKENLNPHE